MPDQHSDIPLYTATDLLRYATGGMNASEMYALEKAALEDPFLAEALEGIIDSAAVYPEMVLQQQIDRLPPLQKEKHKSVVIPFRQKRVLQMAVAATILIGAGWWIFSLLQPKSTGNKNVALNTAAGIEQPAPNDSIIPGLIAADSTLAYRRPVQDTSFQSPVFVSTDQAAPSNQNNQQPLNLPAPAQLAQAEKPAYNKDEVVQNNLESESKIAQVKPDSQLMLNRVETATAQELHKLPDRGILGKNAIATPQYVFRGKITDNQNHPLPYTSILITGSNTGTYSDADGNFSITYEDSLLPVRTKSVGYTSQHITLRSGIPETRISMQEDGNLKDAFTKMAKRKQQAIAEKKESVVIMDSSALVAQPVTGMANYSLYLMNNNRISDSQQMNKQVKLRFEVNLQGNLQNITVEQSSGKTLDNEAIRLLKEGPVWKPGKGNNRGSLVIRF